MCTDDFIQGYYVLESVLHHSGKINQNVMKQAFRRWIDYPYYINFTGPTTRATMQEIFGDSRGSLQGSLESKDLPVKIINDGNSKATNGGAMKIYPAGLLNPGNIDKAIEDAIAITEFTHNNTLSISGACAIASAISACFCKDVKREDIFEASVYGAKRGFELSLAKGATPVAGASVAARIPLAIEIAKKHSTWQLAIRELADIIGNGLHVSEAVPAAIGCIAASGQSSMEAIYAAVNIGNDTDTIGIMVGAIMGALNGYEKSFTREQLSTINTMNNFSLIDTTEEIIEFVNL